ncbi:MAG: hypothetical protein F6J93_20610 [Oscillatoria sp. SIO1A7]|nr:hypothetical protein [Oscillatoria sp. SIO1A7]
MMFLIKKTLRQKEAKSDRLRPILYEAARNNDLYPLFGRSNGGSVASSYRNGIRDIIAIISGYNQAIAVSKRAIGGSAATVS